MVKEMITIIVPVYNAEEYLDSCLGSIIHQTYKNIEVIIINDGSTDRSGAICDAYAQKDCRIRVIHNSNHGVSYSRNCGLDIANGEYIAFVDSDDTVDCQYIECMVQSLYKRKLDLVVCEFNDIYGHRLIHRKLQGKLYKNFTKDYCILDPFMKTPWGKLYNNKLIKSHEIYFDENMHNGEDQVFNYQYYKYTETYQFVKKPLYNYFHRENHSLSQKRKMDNYNNMLYLIQKEIEFLLFRNIGKKNELICDQCVWALDQFIHLDDRPHTFKEFKKRAMSVKKLIEPYYAYTNIKRKILFYALRHNSFLLIYIYYYIKHIIT